MNSEADEADRWWRALPEERRIEFFQRLSTLASVPFAFLSPLPLIQNEVKQWSR